MRCARHQKQQRPMLPVSGVRYMRYFNRYGDEDDTSGGTGGGNIRDRERIWLASASFPGCSASCRISRLCLLRWSIQFRIAAATCEMYWLAADSSEREPNESWRAYCERSRVEVLGKFAKIVAEIDFLAEARNWPTLTAEIERGLNIAKALFFVAYFVTDGE